MNYSNTISKSILINLGLIISFNCLAFESKPERRKEQNITIPAYFVMPLPYSKPGIGEGLLLLGNIANVAGTTADLNIILVSGDAGGTIFDGKEIPLIANWLSVDISYLDINRASVNSYSKRGMEITNKNDFNILELGLVQNFKSKLIFNFDDKRQNFYYTHTDNKYKITSLKDNAGKLLQNLNFTSSNKRDAFEYEMDYTDDHLDPRYGTRFSITYENNPASNSDNADFYTINYNAHTYIPFRENDTLVLNYYQSDAHVNRIGNTNAADIRAELNSNCGGDPACLQAEQELVDAKINERTYGTAASLGGDLRLRSYPADRFNGAHSAFFGAEYRWNITQEATPFDYYIWKDVRTGIQVAFFAEAGTVSEISSKLWSEVRYSYGSGIRLITGSGGVYRADIATGSEGQELTIIFEYPW